jgi:polyisoprenyl-teichoic acid--peptidoglycan teichoic acid transferase
MAREEKPYRVYRGGRQKGKVPLQARPTRAPARVDRTNDSYPGPGPVKVRRRWSRGRKIGIMLALLLLVVIAWGATSYLSLQRGVKVANDRVPAGTSEVLAHQNSLLLSTPTNILILGSDHANLPGREGERSDSIMLLRSDPSRHRIVYLSIPRDLRVPIEGVGDTKINAAMSAGGAPLAIKTVASYTGLPINHVITVDFPRFREVIDALGGITITVPERILSNFDCPLKTSAECTHWKGWRFAKGEQHMSGMRALIYSRVRKNLLNPADTDISRTERQQDVLQATLRKMTSVSSLVKMPFIGSKLVKPLATDLSTAQFLQLGWVYKRGHALHCRLGGTPETLPDGQSVIVSEGDDKERVILAVEGKTAPLPPRPGEERYGAGCVSGSFPR